MLQLAEELQQNSYPGRGIVLGKSADGSQMVIAYFIMGRSENSRNRVFVEENDGIKTQAFDPSKLTDPSLIIYSPVRVINGKTIVTNGDQTDTIYDFIAPNFTPRISGIIDGDRYTLSILKSANGNPDSTCRYFFDYQSPLAGEGHFIHTYRCDGNPIPSFEGEPKKIAVNGDIDAFTESVWNSLNADNKVSLFTRYIDLTTGETQTRICNKNQ